MTDAYTENLADFRFLEIQLLQDLLTAWLEQGLPDDFYDHGVKPTFSRNSGNVFLTNEDYQVAMMNGDKLESFYSLPYGGAEGFLSDLLAENNPDDLHANDVEYILDVAEATGFDLSPPWLDLKIDRILEAVSED